MTIRDLKIKYTENELITFPGETKLRYKAFAPLFQNLHECQVVYHERFTGIIKLKDIKITPERFEAKAIPYLLIEKGDRFDQFFFKGEWKFGSIWSHIRLTGNGLSSPYANWTIWPDIDLVKETERLTINKQFDAALELTIWSKNK